MPDPGSESIEQGAPIAAAQRTLDLPVPPSPVESVAIPERNPAVRVRRDARDPYLKPAPPTSTGSKDLCKTCRRYSKRSDTARTTNAYRDRMVRGRHATRPGSAGFRPPARSAILFRPSQGSGAAHADQAASADTRIRGTPVDDALSAMMKNGQPTPAHITFTRCGQYRFLRCPFGQALAHMKRTLVKFSSAPLPSRSKRLSGAPISSAFSTMLPVPFPSPQFIRFFDTSNLSNVFPLTRSAPSTPGRSTPCQDTRCRPRRDGTNLCAGAAGIKARIATSAIHRFDLHLKLRLLIAPPHPKQDRIARLLNRQGIGLAPLLFAQDEATEEFRRRSAGVVRKVRELGTAPRSARTSLTGLRRPRGVRRQGRRADRRGAEPIRSFRPGPAYAEPAA